jgi:hypothetical protein
LALLDKLEKKLGRFSVPHLTLILVVGQVAVSGLILSQPALPGIMALIPKRVMAGELWRLVTFPFVPPGNNLVFLFFAWYLFFLMGTALDRQWGTFRYNMFLLIGYVATVSASFLTPNVPASPVFLGTSVFLAFAHLYPDFTLLLFFLLPVKIKWLALLAWVGLCLEILVGTWAARALALAAVGNFLLFFGRDILFKARAGHRMMKTQVRKVADKDKPLHCCAVCGTTDKANPNMEFRYCTTCKPASCYCLDHIGGHVHKTEGK